MASGEEESKITLAFKLVAIGLTWAVGAGMVLVATSIWVASAVAIKSINRIFK